MYVHTLRQWNLILEPNYGDGEKTELQVEWLRAKEVQPEVCKLEKSCFVFKYTFIHHLLIRLFKLEKLEVVITSY